MATKAQASTTAKSHKQNCSNGKHSLKAIIYDKRKRVLSIGFNDYEKSHPVMYKLGSKLNLPEKIYLHAEVAAIIKVQDLSKAHSIHVFRVGKSGKYLNAKPCPICQEAINQAGIKHVYHT